jgi:hypothetical protein
MDKLSFSELQGVLLVLERGREIWVKLAKWLSSSNVCLHNLAVLFLMWKLNPNWFPDASTHSEWLGFWHCDFGMFKLYLGCIWICYENKVLHKKVVCRTQHRPHKRECLLAVFIFLKMQEQLQQLLCVHLMLLRPAYRCIGCQSRPLLVQKVTSLSCDKIVAFGVLFLSLWSL